MFGSVARGDERPGSDVDILVEFEQTPNFDQFMDLKFFLEDILGRPVDLVTRPALEARLGPAIELDMGDASGRWELYGTTISDIFVVHVPVQDGVDQEVYYRHELLKATGTVDGKRVESSTSPPFEIRVRLGTVDVERRLLHFDELATDTAPAFNALDIALHSRADDPAVDLRLTNQAFVQPGFELTEEYLSTLTRDYGAPLAELDFSNSEAARQAYKEASDVAGSRRAEIRAQAKTAGRCEASSQAVERIGQERRQAVGAVCLESQCLLASAERDAPPGVTVVESFRELFRAVREEVRI